MLTDRRPFWIVGLGIGLLLVVFFLVGPKKSADQKVAEWNASDQYPADIVTEVSPATQFHVAEAYHQEYFERNGQQPYCAAIIAPKVQKLLDRFGKLTV